LKPLPIRGGVLGWSSLRDLRLQKRLHPNPDVGPVLILIGRERVAQGQADDALLIEAEALAAEAMRV
jgi:hypothetical protein